MDIDGDVARVLGIVLKEFLTVAVYLSTNSYPQIPITSKRPEVLVYITDKEDQISLLDFNQSINTYDGV